ERAAVERLDIDKFVPEEVVARIDLVLREGVEHEGVVGVRAVADADLLKCVLQVGTWRFGSAVRWSSAFRRPVGLMRSIPTRRVSEVKPRPLAYASGYDVLQKPGPQRPETPYHSEISRLLPSVASGDSAASVGWGKGALATAGPPKYAWTQYGGPAL